MTCADSSSRPGLGLHPRAHRLPLRSGRPKPSHWVTGSRSSVITATEFEVNGRHYVHDGTPVVVICIEGSEPAYHEQALQAGCMPWLAELSTGRGVCWSAQCATPALANPNNMSIATGRPPAVHGISANHFLDPATGAEVTMNDPAFLRAPTIFAAAHNAGLEVAIITAKERLRRLLGAGLPPELCLSAEFTDAMTCESVGLPQPEVYSAASSEFVLTAGLGLLPANGVDLMYLSLSDSVQDEYAPGTDEANVFYSMIDWHAAKLDALGAVVVLTSDHSEQAVPFIVNRPLQHPGLLHNYDAFIAATTMAARHRLTTNAVPR